MAREQAKALHGEIERLPERFRLPVAPRYLEGLTVHEAARQLRWSHGTVRSRMARARKSFGVGSRPAASSCLPLRCCRTRLPGASASVSSPLSDVTTQAAVRFATGPAAVDAFRPQRRPWPWRY